MKKDRILFVKKYNANPKFIINDAEILREKYPVTISNVKTTNNIFIIFALAGEFFYLIFNIWRFKLIYIWFADYHSFLPVLFSRLFGKKSVICAGGYECTYIPEINCGVYTKASLSKTIRAFCTSYSLKHCSLILPVDESLIENVNTYIYSDIPGKEPLKDGIKNFIKDINTPFETLYLGYDPGVFKKETGIDKENSVISAGLIINEDEYKRKGFDLLVEAAAEMPEVKFVLVGLNDEWYSRLALLEIKNLSLHKIISYEELTREYSRAKIFAQVSMFEGMPSTLCEAMMCECIPLGSAINGIPKIVNDCGILVEKKEINILIDALKRALSLPANMGEKARKHIINNFSLEKRKTKLLLVINNLVNTR